MKVQELLLPLTTLQDFVALGFIPENSYIFIMENGYYHGDNRVYTHSAPNHKGEIYIVSNGKLKQVEESNE